jgi:hypothetical protein
MLFHSHSGVLSPTVFSGNFPFGTREVGLRGLANLIGTSRVTRKPEPRSVMPTINASSLGLIPIGISQPVKSIPSAPTTRMPKRRWYANAPPGLHYALGPTLPHQSRDLADREFATPNLLPLETPNAGIPIPRTRATCPRSDQQSRSNREIAHSRLRASAASLPAS